MKTSLAIFLGSVSAIQLPPYWDGEYSNTWYYASRPHIVNEEEWKEAQPGPAYSDAVWGSNGRSLLQLDESPAAVNNNYPADKTPVSTLEDMSPEFRDAWNHAQDDYTNHKRYRESAPKAYERIQVGDVVLFAQKDAKKSKGEKEKYDHLYEQKSTITPTEK